MSSRATPLNPFLLRFILSLATLMATLVANGDVVRAADWRELKTVADVCRAYPDRVEQLFLALDLEHPQFKSVKSAVEEGDYPAASSLLLDYYRTSETAKWLREPRHPLAADVAAAEPLLHDTFPYHEAPDTVPRTDAGGLDWRHRGPEGDIEWAFDLNRHYHLATLLEAYLATGDNRFVRRLDQDLRDWIAASLPYPARQTRDPMWRGLETNFRVKFWSSIFFALQNDPDFLPATRLLMLTSLPEHGHYLRHFHRGSGNWLAMESAALAELATHWPEFKASSEWFAHAQQMQQEQIKRQVYPDGAQDELTAHYHDVALKNFARFAEVSRRGSRPLSGDFLERLEKMYDYQARSMRPDGTNPLNSDSDLEDVRPRILAAAEQFQRNDWLHIATVGQRGTSPVGLPSTMFPWAGQLISRSGWDADAQWSFFDVGPWGTGHQHNDKLHLSIAAHGRDLLVDSGRFAYDGTLADKFKSSYARHSRGHNVILVDGCGQGPGPRRASSPLPDSEYQVNEVFDFARGSCDHFEGFEGTAQHTRALFYLRGRYWIVVDRITSDRPRHIEVLWHFHPDCSVKHQGESVATTDPGVGNLRLLPFGGECSWEVELVKGREEPYPQGWYSQMYGQHSPSTCAVYSATVEGNATFAWLLTTAKGDAPQLEASLQEASGPRPVAHVKRTGGADQHPILLEQGEPGLE